MKSESRRKTLDELIKDALKEAPKIEKYVKKDKEIAEGAPWPTTVDHKILLDKRRKRIDIYPRAPRPLIPY